MPFKNIIRNAIAIADKLTSDLQVSVAHEAWISDGATFGEPVYDTSVSRLALIEMEQRIFRLPDGQEILQKAKVTFLRPIEANGADERREPIDLRDRITLPNGYTGPIKVVNGLENQFTDSPFMLEVVLG